MRDFGVDRRVYSPRSPASTRVYLEYLHNIVDLDRFHRLGGREGFDDTIELAVGPVPRRICRTVEADDRRAERRREVQRPCISADHEPGSAEEVSQLAKVRRWRNLGADGVGKRLFTGTPGHESVLADPASQL